MASGPSSSAYASSKRLDRKSTRLNSSHSQISYAVFCLKKKKKIANLPALNYMIVHIHDPYSPYSPFSSVLHRPRTRFVVHSHTLVGLEAVLYTHVMTM